MLEDLIAAAFNDAVRRAEELQKEKEELEKYGDIKYQIADTNNKLEEEILYLEQENNLLKEIKNIYEKEKIEKEKIKKISTEIYRANDVLYTDIALEKIAYLTENNMGNLPICVAKTQYSLSDDKNKIGIIGDHIINVKDIKVYSGAGFIVVYLGNIIDMPGLPKEPNYLNIDVLENEIIGLS